MYLYPINHVENQSRRGLRKTRRIKCARGKRAVTIFKINSKSNVYVCTNRCLDFERNKNEHIVLKTTWGFCFVRVCFLV